jgi:Kef-type K+ transport system membrane component KefB
LSLTPVAMADMLAWVMLAMVVVLVAAVAGKVLGGAAGARIAGHPWRTAFAAGSLVNARALMELIVMKVGQTRG